MSLAASACSTSAGAVPSDGSTSPKFPDISESWTVVLPSPAAPDVLLLQPVAPAQAQATRQNQVVIRRVFTDAPCCNAVQSAGKPAAHALERAAPGCTLHEPKTFGKLTGENGVGMSI